MEELVKQWYADAENLIFWLRQLRDTGCQRLNQAFVTYPTEGVIDPEILQRQTRNELNELDNRQVIANILRDSREKILESVGSLRGRFVENILPRILDFSMGADKWTDFQINGFPGGNCVWPSFEGVAYAMRIWAQDLHHYWSDERVGIYFDQDSINHRDEFDKRKAAVPLTDEVFDQLRNRLVFERAMLLRDLKLHPPKKTKGKVGRKRKTKMTLEEKRHSAAWNSGKYVTYNDVDRELKTPIGTTKAIVDRLRKCNTAKKPSD